MHITIYTESNYAFNTIVFRFGFCFKLFFFVIFFLDLFDDFLLQSINIDHHKKNIILTISPSPVIDFIEFTLIDFPVVFKNNALCDGTSDDRVVCILDIVTERMYLVSLCFRRMLF